MSTLIFLIPEAVEFGKGGIWRLATPVFGYEVKLQLIVNRYGKVEIPENFFAIYPVTIITIMQLSNMDITISSF